jgi:hypothetical protein
MELASDCWHRLLYHELGFSVGGSSQQLPSVCARRADGMQSHIFVPEPYRTRDGHLCHHRGVQIVLQLSDADAVVRA